ncbi:hypothetical protein IH575_04540 [Candidatus Dojkabacteria bacterium]|nr:hypothetical protein [Candidatus Dojkabacteria bacterium]
MKYAIKFRHPKPLVSGVRKTYCDVGIVDGEQITYVGTTGIASCMPSDQFSYEKGRRLSLARALAPLSRDVRREIWTQYFDQKEKDRVRSIMSKYFGKGVVAYAMSDSDGTATLAMLSDDPEVHEKVMKQLTNQEE